jgi:hypothetical protein
MLDNVMPPRLDSFLACPSILGGVLSVDEVSSQAHSGFDSETTWLPCLIANHAIQAFKQHKAVQYLSRSSYWQRNRFRCPLLTVWYEHLDTRCTVGRCI